MPSMWISFNVSDVFSFVCVLYVDLSSFCSCVELVLWYCWMCELKHTNTHCCTRQTWSDGLHLISSNKMSIPGLSPLQTLQWGRWLMTDDWWWWPVRRSDTDTRKCCEGAKLQGRWKWEPRHFRNRRHLPLSTLLIAIRDRSHSITFSRRIYIMLNTTLIVCASDIRYRI